MNHSMKLQSPDGHTKGEYEIAQLIVTNGINGNEHTFTVYSDDNTFDDEKEFGATYVWLNSVDDSLSLDMEREDIEHTLDNNLFQSSLSDIVHCDENIINLIKGNHINGTDFSINIPMEKLKLDINSIIIEEEITDMTFKAKDGELTAKDIVDFGKLVENDTDICVGQLNYLKDPMLNVLERSNLSKEDIQLVEKTFEAFQLDTNFLQKIMKKGINNQKELDKAI